VTHTRSDKRRRMGYRTLQAPFGMDAVDVATEASSSILGELQE